MSNTHGLDLYGTEIKGNLTVIADDCNGNGDGSIEVAGTIYTNTITKYTTSDSGVNVEQTIFDAGNVYIPSTIPGSNKSSGSLIVEGGIVVGKESILYGKLSIANTCNNNGSSDGALVVSGGAYIQKNISIGANGILTLNNPTGSLDISTGSFLTLGGISIQTTTDATSLTSGGGLSIAGGASIAKTLYANLLFTNTANISSLTNTYLASTNSTITNLILQNSTTTSLIVSNLTASNANITTTSIANLKVVSEVVSNSTISNLNNSFASILYETVGNSNINSANIGDLTITSGNFDTITVGNLFVTNELVYNDIITNLSSANTISQSSTISNLNFTNATFSSLYGDNGSNGSLVYSDYISTANLQATNLYVTTVATIANLIAVKETVGCLIATKATIGNLNSLNLVAVNITNSNLITTNLTTTNVLNTNFTTSYLNASAASVGNLLITGTSASCNPTTSALILSGGIYVNETKDSISITSGGGLTVLGGVGISKNVYIGSTINAPTITAGTLYLSQNINSPYSIFTKVTSGSMILLNTCNSYLATGGALISYGGITINNTTDAVACSYGGALTVAGGASINKTLMVCGTINSSSISTGNIYVANSLATVSLASQNVSTTNFTSSNIVGLSGTIASLISNGISTQNISAANFNTTNETVTNLVSTKISSASAVIADINYTNLIGNYLSANYITNNILLTSNNATIGTLNSSDATLGNINFTDGTFGSLFGSYIESYTGTINTLLSTNATVTNLHAPTSTLGNVLATNICTGTLNTTYANISVSTIGSLTVTDLVTTNLTISNPNVNFITAGSLNANNATISNALVTFLTSLYASFGNLSSSNGSFSNVSSSSLITINSTTTNAYITNSTITNIYTIDFNSLYGTIGNLLSTNISTNTLTVSSELVTNSSIQNATITSVLIDSATVNNIILTNGTFGTLIGNNILNTNSTFTNSIVTNSIITNLTNTNLINTSASIGTLNLGAVTAGNINFTGTLYQNGAPYIASQWTTFSNNIAYTTGNVGINTTAPQTTLDVNGTFSVSGNSTLNNVYMNSATVGSINTNYIYSTFGNFVNIFNTNLTSTNILATNVNVLSGIIQNLTTGSIYANYITNSNLLTSNATIESVIITGTGPSSNSTTASVVLYSGGLSINCTVNATSITSGGGQTISGGLAVYKDMYVGQNVYLNNGIITNVTAPSNNLDVANKWYVDQHTYGNVNGNFTQGQVIIATTAGNITGYPSFIFNSNNNSLVLYGTNDATSLTDGGTLTIFGGTSIDKQLYVGSNAYILGVLDVNNQKITSVATPTTPYDAANKYYVDQSISAFTIGNVSGNFTQGQVIVANTGGNITSFSDFTFNGSTLSISSTSNATAVGSGGSLNVSGGASIGLDTYIGGNVYLSNGIITNVTAPSVNLDVANKWYVDQRISAFTIGNVSGNFTQGQVIVANTGGNITSFSDFTFNGSTLSISSTSNATAVGSGGSLNVSGGASIGLDTYIGGNVYLSNGIITNVTAPSTNLDVANKWYVDQHTYGNVNGNFTQGQVIVANTGGNITSFSDFTFDGSTLSINSSNVAIGLNSGGSLIVAGDSSFLGKVFANGINNNDQLITNVAYPVMPMDGVNKAYVDFYLGISTGDIPEQSFILNNNVVIPQDITGFLFQNNFTTSFQSVVCVRIPGLNIYDQWQLNGVLKGTTWDLNTTFIGDFPSNINFSIYSNGSTGQIQYTNSNTTGTATVYYRAITTGYGSLTNVTRSNYMNIVPSGGTGTDFFTFGSLLFGNGSGPILTNTNLYYNTTTGSLSLGGGIITNVTAPSYNLDVANKWYVDHMISGYTIGSVNGNFTSGQVIIGTAGGNIMSYPTFSFDGTTLAITSTANATGLGSGGSFQCSGGASISGKLYTNGIDNNDQTIFNVATPINPFDAVNKQYVDYWLGVSSGDIREASFSLNNLVNTPTSVNGFAFENDLVSSFVAYVYLQIPQLNVYEQWELNGVQNSSGWSMNSRFIGEYQSKVKFTIQNTGTFGQIQYTNLNNSGTATVHFRAFTTGFGNYLNITTGNLVVTDTLHGGTGTNYFTSGTLLFGNGAGPILTDTNILYTSGSLVLENTTLATSLTSGGVFTASGGVIIKRNLIVGNGADFSGTVITNVTAPNSLLDVANKWYVDQKLSSGGNLSLTGNVMIGGTADATSASGGGSLTVDGGAGVEKKLYVGTELFVRGVNITPSLGDLSEQMFSASNNVSSPTNVSGFSFDNLIVRYFVAMVSIEITTGTGTLCAGYELKGIKLFSSWQMNTTSIGENTGINFTIDSSGQVKYTSTNILNWISTKICFRALTTSV
jgi:hypothetical protein